MFSLRRLLGVFVMFAGVIGLILSLTGLVGLFVIRPGVVASATITVDALYTSVDASQKIMKISGDTLAVTVETVQSLSSMLETTASSMKDTQQVFTQLNGISGITLPDTIKAATTSLKAAEEAAKSLEVAIISYESFQTLLSNIPLLSSLIPKSEVKYNPEKPLADSLGEMAANLEDMPSTFVEMSKNITKTDENLVTIQSDLTTMSKNVTAIADGLNEYQTVISESQTSMTNLLTLLGKIKANLNRILTGITIGFVLFFLWLLAAQVVIFNEGWQMYREKAVRIPTETEIPDSQKKNLTSSSKSNTDSNLYHK